MVSVSIHHIFTKDTMSVLKYNNYVLQFVRQVLCDQLDILSFFLFGCSLGHTIHTQLLSSSGSNLFLHESERAASLLGCDGEVVFTPQNKQILRFGLTFSGIDHKLHSTVQLKMSKNSVKTILITLYLSAVQDPEPLSRFLDVFR